MPLGTRFVSDRLSVASSFFPHSGHNFFYFFSYHPIMIMILKIILYIATCTALIVFALDWIVFGKFIPQSGSLGFLGYAGIVTMASFLGLLLEGRIITWKRR
jgi:hypothetical protein